ncbi:hypothetical protein JAO76_17815 [Pontibacter sp. BT310]|uniref:Uncharacterized protein n=1 Tax=Pontibacter populi TaxID=890055 RepID=A0ABS6XIB4_9BACT|nr:MULTISPECIES: hypothetical protein [Pontibacter]MBJ6120068.1 hypothetical protein [Pontibacter sp. BT310]MBR0572497.1 hypothetical protein [Microvirga sp. STS03]MBW3366921.1 hypothetical protein [Pontibacter populi]
MPKYSREEYPANSIVYEGDCPHCGQHFWANKPHAIYCSSKCRTYASKARQQGPQHATPEEPEGMEPTVIGQGNNMRLAYYNPYRQKRMEMEAQGARSFAWEGKTPENEIAYHTLRFKEYEYYYYIIKKLLQQDRENGMIELTDQQRYFLQEQQTNTDINIVGLRRRIQKLQADAQ